MAIASVTRGPVVKPLRLLVYGVDGIGKTTFAAGAPSPVFIGLEDGTATLDVPRFPEPQSWLEVLAAVDELASVDHGYKTLAIDTLDWLEPLCWSHVVGSGKRTKDGKLIDSIEGFEYGKGYTAALDEWRVLLAKRDRLRSSRGMTTILVAHAWIKLFNNPSGENYDRYEIKLNAKAGSLVREWSDAVLFATHEDHTYGTKGERKKGISTGARILHTTRRPAFDAKNRHDLPETIPLDWPAFAEAVAAGQVADPNVLRARIGALLEDADDKLRERVNAAVKLAGEDAGQLARIANKLAATIAIKAQEAIT